MHGALAKMYAAAPIVVRLLAVTIYVALAHLLCVGAIRIVIEARYWSLLVWTPT